MAVLSGAWELKVGARKGTRETAERPDAAGRSVPTPNADPAGVTYRYRTYVRA